VLTEVVVRQHSFAGYLDSNRAYALTEKTTSYSVRLVEAAALQPEARRERWG